MKRLYISSTIKNDSATIGEGVKKIKNKFPNEKIEIFVSPYNSGDNEFTSLYCCIKLLIELGKSDFILLKDKMRNSTMGKIELYYARRFHVGILII